MSDKNKNKKPEDKACGYCSGNGKIIHLGGIEHGTYDTCPKCWGSGKK